MAKLTPLSFILHFSRKKVYHTSTTLRDIAARLPRLYHRFTTEKFYHNVYHNFCHTFGAEKYTFYHGHPTDKAYHEVYHKVYDRMAVDVLSILEQKCEGFNSHLGGVDSLVWARFDFTPLVSREGCANS